MLNNLVFITMSLGILALLFAHERSQSHQQSLGAKRLALVLALALLSLGLYMQELVSVWGLGLYFAFCCCCGLTMRFQGSYAILILLPLLLLFYLCFAAHLVPGFEAVSWISAGPQDKTPNRLLSVDKALAAAAVLLFVSKDFLSQSRLSNISKSFPNQCFENYKHQAVTLGVILVVITLIFSIALQTKVLSWQAQWPSEAGLLFLASNLFLTCIPEEVFFRRLLQQPMLTGLLVQFAKLGVSVELRQALSTLLSILLVSLIFTLMHWAWVPSKVYLVFVLMAAVLYAWVFHRTGSLVWSSFSHFALNASHFLLFSYP